MKVLTICNYLSDDRVDLLTKNKSGYGYVVSDIVRGLAENNSVSVFMYSGFTKSFNYSKANILDNRASNMLMRGASLKSIIRGVLYLFKNLSKGKEALRVLYSILIAKGLKNSINEVDVVHVHGCTPNLMPLIDCCVEENKKVLVTLHGLTSFSIDNKASNYVKSNERSFLCSLKNNKNISLSVLTPKAKDIIVDYVAPSLSDKVHVIPNFLPDMFSALKQIASKKKKVLYIGNLSNQKNQKALLNTILEYEEELQDYRFYFVGEICDDFTYYIEKFSKRDSNVSFLGHLRRERLIELYQTASLTVLLSKDEGFGMSIIEGFSYGVPTIINKNIEIASLIGNLDFVNMVDDVSNTKEVFDALESSLAKTYNAPEIIGYAKKFSKENIIKEYEYLFSSLNLN